MKFVDYNFVSDDDAKTIMESYGYDVKEEASEESPVEQEAVNESEEEQDVFVYESNGVLFALAETVEIIDDAPYIAAYPLSDEDITSLDESTTALLEAVEYDNETLHLGEAFEDENTGDIFIALEKPTEE
mgnify:CR=1 FL=1